VVDLDANPTMCATAEANFRDFIWTGQLTVINRGVAEHKGQLEFWVCDEVRESTSFHRDIASHNGVRHHAITVECGLVLEDAGCGSFRQPKSDHAGNPGRREWAAGGIHDPAPLPLGRDPDRAAWGSGIGFEVHGVDAFALDVVQ
jgi:hypothetical protein